MPPEIIMSKDEQLAVLLSWIETINEYEQIEIKLTSLSPRRIKIIKKSTDALSIEL